MALMKTQSLTEKRNLAVRRSPRILEKTSDNKIMDGNQASIKVIVRVRPPNERESQDNYRTVIKLVDTQMLIFDPKEEDNPFFYRGVIQKSRDLLKKQNKELEFVFNRVFDTDCTNADVFDGSTRDMISSLLEGYNCSVFAYGATGAGKTHTMLGKGADPGITYRTVAELFSQIDQQKENRDFNLGVTYLEIYNENVQDLLHKSAPLFLREDGRNGVVVTGLKIVTINNAEQLIDLLTRGNKNRTQFPTDANGESSRSHAVFQVYINMKNKVDRQMKRVKLSMIDLAGSERASATGCKGDRFKEGANINRSLLALGNCINNLADGVKHIPYRDSKLTRLLKDSLGGNCQTVMIANISPSSMSYEDTYNTLRYANRAKKIKTAAKKNIVSCMLHVSDYKKMLEEAYRENALLKNKLAAFTSDAKVKEPPRAPIPARNATSKNMIIKMQMNAYLPKLQNLWKQKKTLNETLLSLESSDKIQCYKINANTVAEDRLCYLTNDKSPLSKGEQNVSGKKQSHKLLLNCIRTRERIHQDIKVIWPELQKVEEELRALETEISQKNIDTALAKEKELFLKDLDKARQQQQIAHLKKISNLQLTDNNFLNNLISTMSDKLQYYHNLLKGHGNLTDDMQQEFQNMVKRLEGDIWHIKWSDNSAMSKQEEDFYNLTQLDIERIENPLNNCPPIFDIGTNFKLESVDLVLENKADSEDVELPEASNSLNDTFNIETRTSKKRALADLNSIQKEPSPAKQAKAAIVVTKKKVTFGKENNKMVPKISAKSLEILNKLKADRARNLQSGSTSTQKIQHKERIALKSAQLLQKTSKAMPSMRFT